MNSCFHNNQKNEEQILEKIVLEYIDKSSEYLIHFDSLMKKDANCQSPVIIQVEQIDDYKGFNQYSIYPTFSLFNNSDKLPSKLFQINGRDVAMYLKNRKSLNNADIPKFLMGECDIYVLDESSLEVFMCKKCNKSIAIYMGESIPYDMVTQIENFTHNCDHKWDGKIKIEDAVIDSTKEFKIPPAIE
jgi:hypothetical protein